MNGVVLNRGVRLFLATALLLLPFSDCLAQTDADKFVGMSPPAQNEAIAATARRQLEYYQSQTERDASPKPDRRRQLHRLYASEISSLFFQSPLAATPPATSGFDGVRALVGKEVKAGVAASVSEAMTKYFQDILQREDPPEWLTSRESRYQQAWFELMIATSESDLASGRRIARLKVIREQTQAEIKKMDESAPKLADGRSVYRDAAGRMVDQNGRLLTPAEEAYIKPKLPGLPARGQAESSADDRQRREVAALDEEQSAWLKKVQMLKKQLDSLEPK